MRHDSDDQPRPRRQDDDDYRDDDHDDDGPRRRRSESKSKLGLFLALGGGTVVLVVLAVTAFVWPGFARLGVGGGAAAGAAEFMSLAPADSFVTAGLNLTQARKAENFSKELDQLRALLQKAEMPAELTDLILDIDRVFVAGAVRQDKPVFIASLSTVKPYDQEKLKKLPFLGAAETDKGVTFHRVQPPGPPDPEMKDLFLAMPDPKVLVMGIMPKDDFVKALQNRTGKSLVSADLQAACRGHENKYFWAAVANQGELKKKIDEAASKEKEAAMAAMARSASFAFDSVPKDGTIMEVQVTCIKPEDAEAIKTFATDGWKMAMAMADMGLAKAGKENALFKKVLDEAKNSFKVDQNAGTVKASLRVSEATLDELARQAGGGKGIGPVAVAAALFVPAVQKVREAAARTQGLNNLKQMALAMHNHNDVYKQLPAAAICDPNGKPLLSWRVAILPYVEEKQLYDRFKLNEPWDSPNNKQLLNLMPKVFQNPLALDTRPGYTNYRVFVGGGAGFDMKNNFSIPRDFQDGTSNTIMIAEAVDSVPWTKAEELMFNPKGPLPRLDNGPGRGASVALFDASVRTLPPTISAQTLRALITRGAGDIPGKDFDQ